MKERIQKIIANAGLCSRRSAEELIKQGRVKVGRKVATIGDVADKHKDKIVVDGKRLKMPKKRYYALHKPKGYETTLKSTTKKPRVVDLIRNKSRIIPVGRLDVDSTGLILLTNDGDFANLIMHPRYEIHKVYKVKIRGEVPTEKIDKLRKGGIRLKEGLSEPCEVKLLKRSGDTTQLAITLHEGRNRQIRKMIEAVGFQVLELVRVRIGPLTLRGIQEGSYRELKDKEIKALRRAAEKPGVGKKQAPSPREASQKTKKKKPAMRRPEGWTFPSPKVEIRWPKKGAKKGKRSPEKDSPKKEFRKRDTERFPKKRDREEEFAYKPKKPRGKRIVKPWKLREAAEKRNKQSKSKKARRPPQRGGSGRKGRRQKR